MPAVELGQGHDWLTPVREALDRRTEPLAVFLRDDDVGWGDEHLERLLDVVGARGVPLDLAIIPAELTDARAVWLQRRRATFPARLGFHQHGWSHTNHEPSGVRKSEFGRSRAVSALELDIQRGRERLLDRLPGAVDAVFTPPWNRCAPALGPLLVDAGIAVLSCDQSAPNLGLPTLRECPTTVDWFAKRHGVRLSRVALAQRLADAVASAGTLGLLLHHAVTETTELDAIAALLDLLRGHRSCRFVSIVEAMATRDDCVVRDSDMVGETP